MNDPRTRVTTIPAHHTHTRVTTIPAHHTHTRVTTIPAHHTHTRVTMGERARHVHTVSSVSGQ